MSLKFGTILLDKKLTHQSKERDSVKCKKKTSHSVYGFPNPVVIKLYEN